jgi:hypothetical protein
MQGRERWTGGRWPFRGHNNVRQAQHVLRRSFGKQRYRGSALCCPDNGPFDNISPPVAEDANLNWGLTPIVGRRPSAVRLPTAYCPLLTTGV